MGLRSGGNGADDGSAFQQVELFGFYPLPWSKSWTKLSLDTRVDGSLGVLRNDLAGSLILTGGVAVALDTVDKRLSFILGTGPAVLSTGDFVSRDLGGRIHFASHVDVEFAFNPRLAVGYRLQHVSNAGISEPNPGLNVNLIGLIVKY